VSATAKYKGFTDPELISFCLKGDPLAWEALILRYRRLIYSIPVKFCFARADAADIYQNVCLKMIEHLQDLKDETKVHSWLITTTMRHCLQLKAQKQRESAQAVEVEADEQLDPTDNLEDLKIMTEKEQALRESIEELPERCRSLLQMLYFDLSPPSYDEIAEILGMPVASVGPTRARCLSKLRGLVEKRGI